MLSVCSFSVGIAIRRGKGSVFSVVEGISGVGGVSTIGVGGFDVVEGEFDTVIGLIGSLLTRFVVEATKKFNILNVGPMTRFSYVEGLMNFLNWDVDVNEQMYNRV